MFETSAGLQDAREDSTSTVNHHKGANSVITNFESELINRKDKTGIIINVF
jgi:hypothetical protein